MKKILNISSQRKDKRLIKIKKPNFDIKVNIINSKKDTNIRIGPYFRDLQNKKNFLENEKKIKSNFEFKKSEFHNKISLNIFLNSEQSSFFLKNQKKIFSEKSQKKNFFEKTQIKNFSENSKNSSKLTHLKNLINIISIFFKNKEIKFSYIDSLNFFELNIFFFFIKKKFKKNFIFSPKKIKISNFKKNIFFTLKNIQIESSIKRIEEKNRFIFNFVIKKLKKNYLAKDNNHMSNDQNREFLIFYFKNLLKKNIFPIENIFCLQKNNLLKILNNEILYLLFQSKIFYNDFFFYLKKNFFFDYEILITKKFDKVFLEVENMINEKIEENLILKVFKKKMKNNNRVKFPWNLNEVNNAVLHFHKHIDKLIFK